MFNAKQSRLMTTLGIVSEKDRYETYEAYCEVSCEMRAEGMKAASFTAWLEQKVRIAEYLAKRNSEKSLKELA